MNEYKKNEYQPFFVVGSARSGTTMFRLMLNKHSCIHIPPESWFIIDLIENFPLKKPLNAEQLSQAVQIVKSHYRWKDWGVCDEKLDHILTNIGNATLGEFVNAIFKTRTNKKIWGDKTPGYARVIEKLHQIYPNAKYIHLIRDARDVCTSLKKTGWHGTTAWTISRYWNKHVSECCRQGRRLPKGLYLELYYQELVSNTEKAIRQVCEFIGEQFEPQMLEFYKNAEEHIPNWEHEMHRKTCRPPSPSDLDRWKKELAPLHVLIFESGAFRAMNKVKQKLSHPIAAPLLFPSLLIIEWIAKATLSVRRKLGLHIPDGVRKIF